MELVIEWLPTILLGAAAGWLGSLFFKGKGSGLIVNVVLGIAGAYVGSRIFQALDIAMSGMGGKVLSAAIGAFVILWVFRLLFGRAK